MKEKKKDRHKLDRSELPTTKKVIENYGKVSTEYQTMIDRNIHPYRQWSLISYLGGFGFDKIPDNPIINPPVAKLRNGSDAEKMLEKSFLQFAKTCSILALMIPKIMDKYPENVEHVEKFVTHANFITDVLNSVADNRYKRSALEWYKIANYAKEFTVRQASKKYYGITPAGKKIYLNHKQIKKKISQMEGFKDQLDEHHVMWMLYMMAFSQIISEDQQLIEEYKKISNRYDNNRDSLSEHNSKYSYTYYKIIHYDHNVYEKQKEEWKKGLRKSKPDGRVECRIKESEIPSDVIGRLSSKKKSHDYG